MLKILRDLLRYNREFLAGAVLLGIILAMIGLSFMSPFDETTLYAVAPDMPPSLDHWFGTTSRGQDVFWQMTSALRNTLAFGILVAVLSRLIALVVGDYDPAIAFFVSTLGFDLVQDEPSRTSDG